MAASVVAERGRVRRADAQQRRHRAGSFLAGALHRLASHDHHVDRVAEPDHAGRHQRREFAERVSRDADRSDPRVLEDAGGRDPAPEQRRLHERRRGERIGVTAPGREVAPERIGGLEEHPIGCRMADPRVGHPLELRSLSGEQHRDPPVRHGMRA